jgi:hypothetical protein
MIERAAMLLSPVLDQIATARREAEAAAYVVRLETQFRDEHEAFVRARHATMDEREAARAGRDEYVERRMREMLK